MLVYLVRLADRCDVDLSAAALRKLALNAAKYPADRVRGRSEKYDEYDGSAGAKEGAAAAAADVAADWASGAGARAAARARYGSI